MEVVLLVQSRKSGVTSLRLKGDTLIGRGTECQLRVASTAVSRRHCHLRLTDHAVFVRDLGSSNGTQVDGAMIPAEVDVVLRPGASLVVGPFRCTVQYSPPAQSSQHALAAIEFRSEDDDDSAIELPAAGESAIELPAAEDSVVEFRTCEPPAEVEPVDEALEDFFRST